MYGGMERNSGMLGDGLRNVCTPSVGGGEGCGVSGGEREEMGDMT